MEYNPKQVEVTYKFYLPDNESEMRAFLRAKHNDYESVLSEIHYKCRQVWKYEEDPSEDRISLAEEISEMVGESGALDQ